MGKQLITGRNLHAMAIRGARAYKKALAFSTHKWDRVTMQPKKSGETIEDVIEYVRQRMYHEKQKEKKPSDSSEEESESEDNEISPPSPSPSHPPPSPPPPPSTTETTDTTPSSTSNANPDISILDSPKNNDESNCNEDSDEDTTDIPSEYLFPSFFVFVLYGPFVPPSDQLNINLIDNNAKKKGEGTRAELRANEAKEKAIDAENDTTSTRGFTTDQRIDIESLNMQKETMVDRKNEVAMVALSLEKSAMTELVDAAERRALLRCPEYDNTNPFWKKVDVLLEEQETFLGKIRKFNEQIMGNSASSFTVSEFLNQPSPTKPSSNKRKATELDDSISLDSSVGNDDGDDISSTVNTLKAKVSNNRS